MDILTQIKMVLRSRKFWALALALLAAAAAYAGGKIDGWQTAQLVVAALAAYSTGVAIEDAGQSTKKQLPSADAPKLSAGGDE